MFAQRCMNDTAIKQYFGGIGNVFEDLQSLIEFIVVVAAQGGHPRLDFLLNLLSVKLSLTPGRNAVAGKMRTAFKDIVCRQVRSLRTGWSAGRTNKIHPRIVRREEGVEIFGGKEVREREVSTLVAAGAVVASLGLMRGVADRAMGLDGLSRT